MKIIFDHFYMEIARDHESFLQENHGWMTWIFFCLEYFLRLGFKKCGKI